MANMSDYLMKMQTSPGKGRGQQLMATCKVKDNHCIDGDLVHALVQVTAHVTIDTNCFYKGERWGLGQQFPEAVIFNRPTLGTVDCFQSPDLGNP